MKQIQSILKVALLSCTFLLFLNCDTDNDLQESHAHKHEDANKISFTDFLSKTKIKKFDVNIKPVRLENDLQGRSAEDFEFTGFTVDTLTVKQLVKKWRSYIYLTGNSKSLSQQSKFLLQHRFLSSGCRISMVYIGA